MKVGIGLVQNAKNCSAQKIWAAVCRDDCSNHRPLRPLPHLQPYSTAPLQCSAEVQQCCAQLPTNHPVGTDEKNQGSCNVRQDQRGNTERVEEDLKNPRHAIGANC